MRAKWDTAISFNTSTLITCVVGTVPNVQRFSVHEGFLRHRSEFFRRALSGSWTESKERVIKFPDDNVETFATYVNLVYTGRVATDTLNKPSVDHGAELAKEFNALSRLYVLAEKLCDPAAKNSILDAILATADFQIPFSKERYSPGYDAVQIMYNGTPKPSLGRQLLADLWTFMDSKFITELAEKLPKDFLADLATALLKDRPTNREAVARRNGASQYHEKVV